MARYDGIAEWYDRDFLSEVHEPGLEAAARLLGRGSGRLLDIGCGTGAHTARLAELGWQLLGVDVSADMLRLARERGLEVVQADARDLPFGDRSFDAAVSLWTHTDVDEFVRVVAEVSRVLDPGAPFVYVGVHPAFVGPHSRFMFARGTPELHPGYLGEGRYDSEAPGVGSPTGLRAKVGAAHLTLESFLNAFLSADLILESFEELALEGELYPFAVALRWHRAGTPAEATT
ncbi:MAG TPA: methyltransferase domain-containing protein [Gaiellaceae bacterium]